MTRILEIVTCEKPFRRHISKNWLIDDNDCIHIFDVNPGIEEVVFKNYLYYTIYKPIGIWEEPVESGT